MAATFKEKTITQYSVKLTLQNGEDIHVTFEYSVFMKYWRVNVPTGVELNIRDIIDIATAVYDAEIFDEKYAYNLLCDNWPHKITINSKKEAAECVISQIELPFIKKEES